MKRFIRLMIAVALLVSVLTTSLAVFAESDTSAEQLTESEVLQTETENLSAEAAEEQTTY